MSALLAYLFSSVTGFSFRKCKNELQGTNRQSIFWSTCFEWKFWYYSEHRLVILLLYINLNTLYMTVIVLVQYLTRLNADAFPQNRALDQHGSCRFVSFIVYFDHTRCKKYIYLFFIERERETGEEKQRSRVSIWKFFYNSGWIMVPFTFDKHFPMVFLFVRGW